jgi:hypothetical protein
MLAAFPGGAGIETAGLDCIYNAYTINRPSMKNSAAFLELSAALADFDKARTRLEGLRDWARGEVARDNTASARALLERSVPERLRESEPSGASEAVQAGRCFREVCAIFKRTP